MPQFFGECAIEQAYNAPAVVDQAAQIIVAAGLTQEANDKQQLVPSPRPSGGDLRCGPLAPRHRSSQG